MIFHLDGREVCSRAALHALLKRGLNLPDYYGANLDALCDCLSEMREHVTVEIVHTDALHNALDDYAQSFIETLEEMNVTLILR